MFLIFAALGTDTELEHVDGSGRRTDSQRPRTAQQNQRLHPSGCPDGKYNQCLHPTGCPDGKGVTVADPMLIQKGTGQATNHFTSLGK